MNIQMERLENDKGFVSKKNGDVLYVLLFDGRPFFRLIEICAILDYPFSETIESFLNEAPDHLRNVILDNNQKVPFLDYTGVLNLGTNITDKKKRREFVGWVMQIHERVMNALPSRNIRKEEQASYEAPYKVFENTEFGKVRVCIKEGDPWFVAKDLCEILKLGNSRQAVSRLDSDDKGVSLLMTPSGEQNMQIVNESGMYCLILTSRRPEAKRFKRWVTSEVLPALRREGTYTMPENKPAGSEQLSGQASSMDVLEQQVMTLYQTFMRMKEHEQVRWRNNFRE